MLGKSRAKSTLFLSCGVVDHFVRWFLGGIFGPRTDVGVGVSVASPGKCKNHVKGEWVWCGCLDSVVAG